MSPKTGEPQSQSKGLLGLCEAFVEEANMTIEGSGPEGEQEYRRSSPSPRLSGMLWS